MLNNINFINRRVVQRDRVVGNARRSVLVFRGHMGVHGLFNFLLNWRDNRVEFRSRGPPMLVAPCVFLNATVKQAEVCEMTSLIIHFLPIT